MFLLRGPINLNFIDIRFEFNFRKFSHFNSRLYKFSGREELISCVPNYMFGYVFREYNSPNPFRINNALGGIFCVSTKIKFLYFSILGFARYDPWFFALVLLRKISKWKKIVKLSTKKREIFRNFYSWFN